MVSGPPPQTPGEPEVPSGSVLTASDFSTQPSEVCQLKMLTVEKEGQDGWPSRPTVPWWAWVPHDAWAYPLMGQAVCREDTLVQLLRG